MRESHCRTVLFFNAVCSDPMTLMFCVSDHDNPAGKATVRNIAAIGQFVINLSNESSAAAMNLTATPLPDGESKFDWAGITATPSKTIKVPRVTEAPIAFECRLHQLLKIGTSDSSSGTTVVFGEVQGIYVRDDLYDSGRILLEAYQPIGRLGGNSYTRVTDTFEMVRVSTPSHNRD
ncbi:MAG: flavin reductase family protein [Caldilineaceae bacterium]